MSPGDIVFAVSVAICFPLAFAITVARFRTKIARRKLDNASLAVIAALATASHYGDLPWLMWTSVILFVVCAAMVRIMNVIEAASAED
ncbi:hypothetical protein ACFV4X_26415 [Streptomyces ardesiacus]|uniref:hypothetical protein n=1 Tax=Streptomyces ardesiacus TaxID=285564 RepID=UPI00365477A9